MSPAEGTLAQRLLSVRASPRGGLTCVGRPATEVRLDGPLVRDLDGLSRDEFLNIPQPEEALRSLREATESSRFTGVAAVQAERGAPYGVVRRVMFSCQAAGYTNISYSALEGPRTNP